MAGGPRGRRPPWAAGGAGACLSRTRRAMSAGCFEGLPVGAMGLGQDVPAFPQLPEPLHGLREVLERVLGRGIDRRDRRRVELLGIERFLQLEAERAEP